MSRVATLQVCDDVAYVGQNKNAYIGLYGPDLIVPRMPTRLDQLHFIVTFRTPVDSPPSVLRTRIEMPDAEPLVEDHSQYLSQRPAQRSPDARFFQVTLIKGVKPFEIARAGTIRVFVEDEAGDHYAGGLNLKIGAVPDNWVPQAAAAANLIAAHFERIDKNSPFADLAARQLIESLVRYLKYLGHTPTLQQPDKEVRIQFDAKQVHVFFPEAIDPPPLVTLTVNEQNGVNSTVTHSDQVGFVAEFEPQVPEALAFDYQLSAQRASKESKRKRKTH